MGRTFFFPTEIHGSAANSHAWTLSRQTAQVNIIRDNFVTLSIVCICFLSSEERKTDRERERERERDRQTDRQRQTDRETDRQTETEIKTERDREGERNKQPQRDRERQRQRGRERKAHRFVRNYLEIV